MWNTVHTWKKHIGTLSSLMKRRMLPSAVTIRHSVLGLQNCWPTAVIPWSCCRPHRTMAVQKVLLPWWTCWTRLPSQTLKTTPRKTSRDCASAVSKMMSKIRLTAHFSSGRSHWNIVTPLHRRNMPSICLLKCSWKWMPAKPKILDVCSRRT